MSVRAKFRVQTVTDHFVASPDEVSKTVILNAVTRDDDAAEDFWKYTPAGNINITIQNPTAAEPFVPGKSFYVDFTEAEA